MSAYKSLVSRISELAPGSIVTMEQLSDIGSRSAIATALTRLTQEKSIVRIRRGLYLKPKDSRFGVLPPSSEEMITAVTDNGKKRYVAGLTAYNKLGLTSQVPNSYILRGGVSDLKMKIGGTRIIIKAGKVPKSKSDIPLLMVLDALREIKQIPDATLNETMRILKSKILEFNKITKVRLIDLALDDKPFVRAVVGAILDETNPEITLRLSESLNSLTSYKLGNVQLKYASKWKIK